MVIKFNGEGEILMTSVEGIGELPRLTTLPMMPLLTQRTVMFSSSIAIGGMNNPVVHYTAEGIKEWRSRDHRRVN